MFAEQSEYMQTEQFHNLLYTVYKIAMDHYPDGPQSCRQLFKTLHAVVDSAVSSNYCSTLLLAQPALQSQITKFHMVKYRS